MRAFLKSYPKKIITIEALAQVYLKKMIVLWQPQEKKQFVEQLDQCQREGILTLKRSLKGNPAFDFIENKIAVHAWKMNEPVISLPLHLFPSELCLDPSYYLKNPEAYSQDQKHIESLVHFLQQPTQSLTINEISYLIFGDEKALAQPDKASVKGDRILKNLNLPLARLCPMETIAPFYFPVNLDGDTVCIVENKETCFSLFRILTGKETNIKGIIYGEGRAVMKIFGFIETYGLSKGLSYVYYGDIDQEGLDIAAALIQKYPDHNICLSKVLYPILAQQPSRLLLHKRILSFEAFERILNPLPQEAQEKIKKIIAQEACIPQEALNFHQLKGVLDGLHNQLC